MTPEQLVLILGAYSAFVLGAFGLLIKFVLDTRKTGVDTNRAVNNRPPDAPRLRELVEDLHGDVRQLRRDGDRRHGDNVERIHQLSRQILAVDADLKSHMREIDERNQGDGK